MNFGDKLKQARNKRKMTQKVLAELINVRESTISDWEHNRHKPDNLDTFKKLCDTLDVPSTYFICENEETSKLLVDCNFALFLNDFASLSSEDKKKVENLIQELKK